MVAGSSRETALYAGPPTLAQLSRHSPDGAWLPAIPPFPPRDQRFQPVWSSTRARSAHPRRLARPRRAPQRVKPVRRFRQHGLIIGHRFARPLRPPAACRQAFPAQAWWCFPHPWHLPGRRQRASSQSLAPYLPERTRATLPLRPGPSLFGRTLRNR